MEEVIIISLGGSMIIPDQIDVEFLKEFKDLVFSHVSKGKKFVIITGGGKLARRYQDASKQLATPSAVDLDWIGIASLKLNAELMRLAFAEHAHDVVISNLSTKFGFEKPVVIGSAYEPGHSTDFDSIEAAISVGAKKVINLSNVDHVYDSDPKINPHANKIHEISWADYRNLIPKEWNPGLNSPFDPMASELAQKENISVMIMNGKPIDNLAKCLNGEKFDGTIIS